MPQECQGLKKKNLKRKQQHLPSLLSRCQLQYTRQALDNTVCGLLFLFGEGGKHIYTLTLKKKERKIISIYITVFLSTQNKKKCVESSHRIISYQPALQFNRKVNSSDCRVSTAAKGHIQPQQYSCAAKALMKCSCGTQGQQHQKGKKSIPEVCIYTIPKGNFIQCGTVRGMVIESRNVSIRRHSEDYLIQLSAQCSHLLQYLWLMATTPYLKTSSEGFPSASS